MNRRSFAVIAAVVMLLCFVLAGCGDKEDVSIESTKVDTTLHTMMYSEMKEGQFSVLHTYGSGEESYVFWCESEMSKFGFYPLSYDMENDVFSRAGETYYFPSAIKKGEAVHAGIVIPEVVPDMAVTYTVAGQTFEYALCYNGNTGGVSLMEFTLGAPTQDTTSTSETTTTTTTQVSDESLEGTIIYGIADSVLGTASYNSIEASGAATVDGYVCSRYTVSMDGVPVANIAINESLMHSFIDFGCDGSYFYVLPDEDGFYYVNRDFEVVGE